MLLHCQAYAASSALARAYLPLIIASCLCFFSRAAEIEGAPDLAKQSSASNQVSAALPTKPSDDEIDVLEEGTRTNKLSDLGKTAPLAKFQTALETARKLRDKKDLKRAENGFIQLLEGRAPEEIKHAALLDLGGVMQEQKEFSKAQQLYSEYVRRYEKDPAVPEVLLRQGYIYRQMGVPVLALSKFYAVISTCLNLKLDQLDYYQKLVLRAQAEIAETYFLEGKYVEAADYLNRLLRLDSADLERAEILSKLLHCYSSTAKYAEATANARLFLEKYPDHAQAPEVHFLLASALKKLGRNEEALQEIERLLQAENENSKIDPKERLYWQQRAGNEVANQLYREGDFLNALQVYQLLADLNRSAEWQIPVWYQIGLVFENLKQHAKACDMYNKLIAREKESAEKTPSAALKQVAEMAAWRRECLRWETSAQVANQQLQRHEEKDSL